MSDQIFDQCSLTRASPGCVRVKAGLIAGSHRVKEEQEEQEAGSVKSPHDRAESP